MVGGTLHAVGSVMRLISRRDLPLASSLIIGMIVLFNRPLRGVLAVAAEVERTYDIDLLPALTVLTATFAFHLYRQYRDALDHSRRVEARSEQAERLLSFGRALAGTLTYPALQQALHRQMPMLCGERSYWLLRRAERQWVEVANDVLTAPGIEQTESMAIRALQLAIHDAPSVTVDRFVCLPLMVGDAVAGVLGVEDRPALSEAERRELAAASPFIALALRSVQVLEERAHRGTVDELTRCLTRGAALERLRTELRRAGRTERPISVVLFDMDDFKSVNDTFGHLAGDQVLEDLGSVLEALLRSSDLRCRMGGDEFLVVLPDTSRAGASDVAEKIRAGVGQHVRRPDGQPVTISLGVATAAGGQTNALVLIADADQALYKAKRGGRNRSCCAPAQEAEVHPSSQSLIA